MNSDDTLDSEKVINPVIVFDRLRVTHRWEDAFHGLSRVGDQKTFDDFSNHLLYRNWKKDHRVTEDRERSMLGSPEFGVLPDANEWKKQIQDHFVRRLCRPSGRAVQQSGGVVSAFEEPFNQFNLIDKKTLPPHERLIHVASLNTILWRLIRTDVLLGYRTPSWLKPFFLQHFPDSSLNGKALMSRRVEDYQPFVDTLAVYLQKQGPDVIKQLAGFCIGALGSTQPPWWSGIYQEVSPYVKKENWTGLCQMLGLGHLKAGEWLLTWIYPVSDVDSLYRPTVVEANDSPYHFPSPPDAPFGITMPLKEGMGSGLREMVHSPLSGDLAEQCCTGTLGKIQTTPSPLSIDAIRDLREEHRQNLYKNARKNSPTIPWLKRHGT